MTDLELVYLCALRYALGRKTYITGVVSDFLKLEVKALSDKCKKQMIREIKEAKDLGHTCDKKSWTKLLKELKKK